tara:strand:- start:101 stop:256 length:156 start_codon:yes stop_codon:yes gene_type:complete
MFNTLLPLVTLPLIGFVIVLFLPMSNDEEKERGKVISLIFTVLAFLESLRL